MTEKQETAEPAAKPPRPKRATKKAAPPVEPAAAAVEEEQTEPAPLTATPARRQLPSWFPVAVVAFAVGLVAMLGIWQWSYDNDLAAERSTRNAASTAARNFATALLTYDFRDLESARGAVNALITDHYREIYEQAFTIGLEPQITKTQATSQATVREVFLTEVANDAAKAIVIVDAETTSTAGKRTLTGTYLQLDLVKVGGKFLVDSLTSVSASNASLTPITPGGETTTTTAN